MNILLLSSSKFANSNYLEHAESYIKQHLGNEIKKLLFIPYAGVSVSYDDYEKQVKDTFANFGYEIESIHRSNDPKQAVENSQAIVIGGGNTFCLLDQLYQFDLVELIRTKVNQGTAYIGWSAGSNLAGPTIRTTNDMPIIQPTSFDAFNFVPFQINPHYIEGNPPGHQGETREQRINEFLIANPGKKVVAIPEGCALQIKNGHLNYIGVKTGVLFINENEKKTIEINSNLDYLLA